MAASQDMQVGCPLGTVAAGQSAGVSGGPLGSASMVASPLGGMSAGPSGSSSTVAGPCPLGGVSGDPLSSSSKLPGPLGGVSGGPLGSSNVAGHPLGGVLGVGGPLDRSGKSLERVGAPLGDNPSGADSGSLSTVDAATGTMKQESQPQDLLSSHFLDGSLLPRLAAEHCASFQTALLHEKRSFSPSREITLGSACTGSAADLVCAFFAADAIRKAFGLKEFSIKPVFACEICKEKRAWIQGVHEACASGLGSSAPCAAFGQEHCIFKDIKDIGNTHAPCCVHGKDCAIPRCSIFVCCTSCK